MSKSILVTSSYLEDSVAQVVRALGCAAPIIPDECRRAEVDQPLRVAHAGTTSTGVDVFVTGGVSTVIREPDIYAADVENLANQKFDAILYVVKDKYPCTWFSDKVNVAFWRQVAPETPLLIVHNADANDNDDVVAKTVGRIIAAFSLGTNADVVAGCFLDHGRFEHINAENRARHVVTLQAAVAKIVGTSRFATFVTALEAAKATLGKTLTLLPPPSSSLSFGGSSFGH